MFYFKFNAGHCQGGKVINDCSASDHLNRIVHAWVMANEDYGIAGFIELLNNTKDGPWRSEIEVAFLLNL
jgi:hypothetical protein